LKEKSGKVESRKWKEKRKIKEFKIEPASLLKMERQAVVSSYT